MNISTQITGREDLYGQNGLRVRRQIEKIEEKSRERIAASGKAPMVLCLRGSSSFVRAKSSKGNVLGAILKGLGCINISDDGKGAVYVKTK